MIAQYVSFELPELVFVKIYAITADGVFFDAWMRDEDIAVVNVITGGCVDYGALTDVVGDIKEMVQYALDNMYAYPPAIAPVFSIKPAMPDCKERGRK